MLLCVMFYSVLNLSDEYMKLLTVYRRGSEDSTYRLKHCVERHFASLADCNRL